jgi:hypothetical protein
MDCLIRLVVAALLATAPLSLLVMLFPALVLVRSAQCLAGSVRLAEQNSLTYSGRPPARPWRGPLPRVTVQMPVFLEDLDFVIRPSIM